MPSDTSDDVAPSSVTEDLVQLDKTFDTAKSRREEILRILEPLVKSQVIDPAKNPRGAEVSLQLVNTYLGLIEQTEKSIVTRVRSKLKRDDSESNNKHNLVVTELLSRIQGSTIQINAVRTLPDDHQRAQALDVAFTENNLDPVMDTELLTDPKDV